MNKSTALEQIRADAFSDELEKISGLPQDIQARKARAATAFGSASKYRIGGPSPVSSAIRSVKPVIQQRQQRAASVFGAVRKPKIV